MPAGYTLASLFPLLIIFKSIFGTYSGFDFIIVNSAEELVVPLLLLQESLILRLGERFLI